MGSTRQERKERESEETRRSILFVVLANGRVTNTSKFEKGEQRRINQDCTNSLATVFQRLYHRNEIVGTEFIKYARYVLIRSLPLAVLKRVLVMCQNPER